MSKPQKNTFFDEKNGIGIVRYSLTDSTNKRAREYASVAEPLDLPMLFIADGQTDGRGRLGRSFFSPAATGLYMTLLLRAPSREEGFCRLTALSAVAAVEAIRSELGISVKIKWVNDLYLDGKKIAGILAESFLAGGERLVALGIGINLCTHEFPEELKTRAGALLECCDADVGYSLSLEISKRLLASIDADNTDEYMKIYRESSCVIGKRVRFVQNGEARFGVAEDINADGALIIRVDGGESIELSSGEISLFVEEE